MESDALNDTESLMPRSQKPTKFGTDYIGGLDVSRASHKIDPGSLTVSKNGWTWYEGVWHVAKRAKTLYSGFTSIGGFAAGRMGSADHQVWTDDDTVYDNGVSSGTVTDMGDRDINIRDIDDSFLILNATADGNHVYGRGHLRQLGPWQPQTRYLSQVPLPDIPAIDVSYSGFAATPDAVAPGGITAANPAVVALTAGHGFQAGDNAYIDGVVGMTEINKRTYKITAVTATSATLDLDASSYSAWVSDGDLYQDGCGFTGTFKYYMTCTLELSDGTVLESKPRAMLDYFPEGNIQSTGTAATVTVTDATHQVALHVTEFWQLPGDAGHDNYEISGTEGVDYKPGFRLYRTKDSGEDFYLVKSWEYDTSSPSDPDGGIIRENPSGSNIGYYVTPDTGATSPPGYYDVTPDSELGAVYAYSLTERGTPPRSSLVANYAERLWFNDLDNTHRLWWGATYGIDYVDTAAWIEFPDVITGLYEYGDGLAVFSADRMWVVTMPGGIPAVRRVKTPVGTKWGQAMTLTDRGLLFLREDGLWSFDGYRVDKVSRKASVLSITDPVSVTAAGDIIFLSGASDAYVVIERDGGDYWHGSQYTFTTADATSGKFYAADGTTVYELFDGADGQATLETMDFTVAEEFQATEVVIDFDGGTVPEVYVIGNREESFAAHTPITQERGDGRRLLRYSINRLMNHVVRVRLNVSGPAAVYGVWLEGEY